MQATYTQHILHFRQPAGTSRGVYTTRKVWYVTLREGNRTGTGECAPLPNLSCDDVPNYEKILRHACQQLCDTGCIDYEALLPYPSILFGLECAWNELCGIRMIPDEYFDGKDGIPINGLIWMGTHEEMKLRLEEKIATGFRCIKIKIGAINWNDEMHLLDMVRSRYNREQVELRVDANGAFTPDEALKKLQQLASFDIHSIEQPIRAGQWNQMAELAATSPVVIALDEELIGINHTNDKIRLLDTIRPQYIVLKPSLHGGIKGCDEWIRLAEERGIGWWATSALESNIGLTHIAAWCASKRPAMPQGLGTGLLFTDNTEPKTRIVGDKLFFE